MDGVITFFASQQVMKAEKVLKKNGFNIMLIPGPREISPNCGTALCFEYEKEKETRSILKKNKIVFEAIHYYPQAKKISKWIDS
jgi:hypothetical protein